MKKIKLSERFSHYHHIDNGGPMIAIVDRGLGKGIFLEMTTSYHGYPSISVDMQLDAFDMGEKGVADFLQKSGLMFIKAAEAVSQLSFEDRFAAENEVSVK